MKILTDIEQAKIDFYKLHPEAIIKSEQPRTIAICNKCLGHIAINNECLNPRLKYISTYANKAELIKRYSCPHCTSILSIKEGSWDVFKPIPHTVVRMVKHWTKLPVKGWFKKDSGDYFYEYEVLRMVDYSES